jgi:hypothetical protein
MAPTISWTASLLAFSRVYAVSSLVTLRICSIPRSVPISQLPTPMTPPIPLKIPPRSPPAGTACTAASAPGSLFKGVCTLSDGPSDRWIDADMGDDSIDQFVHDVLANVLTPTSVVLYS